MRAARSRFSPGSGRGFGLIRAFAAGLALLAGVAQAAPVHPEVQLQGALDAIEAGDLADASQRLESLLKRQPNFRLANLLYAQVLSLRAGPRGSAPLGDGSDPRLKELLDELHARTDPAREPPPPGLVPDVLVRLAPEVRHAIVVDLAKTRLYVLENRRGTPHVIRSYYAGIARNGFGKKTSGDLRTPVGVYQITGWTPGRELPPLYGAGAFQMNYPNAWDRSLGKSGYGIWLHGVPPDTYVRAPRSSEGCVTLANEDLLALQPMIAAGNTPVILADHLNWVPAERLADRRAPLLRSIENWRAKLAARDTAGLMRYYVADADSDDGISKVAFREARAGAAGKRVQVQLSALSLYDYPGEPNLVLARFVQTTRSGTVRTSARTEQFWRRQANGEWKIVREENH